MQYWNRGQQAIWVGLLDCCISVCYINMQNQTNHTMPTLKVLMSIREELY
jgi:hypothetical protein